MVTEEDIDTCVRWLVDQSNINPDTKRAIQDYGFFRSNPGGLLITLDHTDKGLWPTPEVDKMPFRQYVRALLEEESTGEEIIAKLVCAKMLGSKPNWVAWNMHVYMLQLRNLTVPDHNDPSSVQAPNPVDPGVPG